MKKLVLTFIGLTVCLSAYADIDEKLNIRETDGSPDSYPYSLKVSPGSLVDNGDGTVTLTTGGGSAGGSNSNIQYNNATAFGGDGALNWNPTSNMLGISRDASQTGYALVISGDLASQGILANISHDGTAFFQSIQALADSNISNGDFTLLESATNQTSQIFIDSEGTALFTIDRGGSSLSRTALMSYATGGVNQFSTGLNDTNDTFYITDESGNTMFSVTDSTAVGNANITGTLTLGTDLSVTEGGTGVSTITDGSLLIGKGTAAIENTGLMAKGDLVVGDGATNPVLLNAGANGTILSADSSTASGLSWVARNTILPVTTKGSIITYSTVPIEFGVGANGTVLSADSSTATGLKWVTPPSGGGSGESNTASNLGTGNQWFSDKSGVDLRFRTAVSGDNVSMVTGTNDITINVSSVPSEDITGILDIDTDTNLRGGTLATLTSNGVLNVAVATSDVTGVLAVGAGGTSTTTHTDGAILLGTGSSAIHSTGVLSKGVLIVGDGTTDPTLLTVGANGQILSADSSTATGLVWVNRNTVLPVTTKGDILIYEAAPVRFPVGANGTVLSADSSTATGLAWVAPPSGGGGSGDMILSATQTNTGVKTFNAGTLKFPDVAYIADANGNEIVSMDTVASAVNYIVVANSAIGTNPTVSADGSDTNVGINLNTRGTGGVVITASPTATQSLITSGLVVNNGQGNTTAGAFKVLSADGSAIMSSDPSVGGFSTTGKFVSSNINDLGWSFVDGADNTTGNSMCNSACVFGITNATGTAVTALVGCSDSTADSAICAGSN